MRRTLILAVAAATLIGLLAAPAAADRPEEIPITNPPFHDYDPCTGGDMYVTINFTVFVHEHNNNGNYRLGERSGSTDTGYVLIGGHENGRFTKNGESGSFKDVWRNPDNGDKMQATGKFRLVGNSPVIDSFELRCVGGPHH